ncbi:sigma factor-like helix-turn-helix DNA-binding protein [Streptomyces sp. NPDC001070]
MRGRLKTVARNIVVDGSRSAAARREAAAGPETLEIVQADQSDAVIDETLTTSLLGRLSTAHREVLVHMYFHGGSIQETAQLLGVPVGTVKSRQHYATSRLRTYMRREKLTTISADVRNMRRAG